MFEEKQVIIILLLYLENKLISSKTLKKVDLSLMPNYLRENSKKYINWLDI